MFSSLRFDYRHSLAFVSEEELFRLQSLVTKSHHLLHEKKGAGKEYLGWLAWPHQYDQTELQKIKDIAQKMRAETDVFIVIGIGGSYLGAKAALTMLNHSFYNQIPRDKRGGPEIYFLGHQLSSTYLTELMEVIEGKEIAVNVISKSGTTTEPAIAFRLIRQYLEKKYGKEKAKERIIVTTDRQRGILRQLATLEGYETLTIPEDIGGRYSVLTSVGLLAMAVTGIDPDEVLAGAQSMYQLTKDPGLEHNPSYQYAAIRQLMYQKGKALELLVYYEPKLGYFSEWWKQLFGESEGKEHKGIFPAACQFTTDLHSLGQYIQEGRRHLFETILHVEKVEREVMLPACRENVDQLNYLSGKSMHWVNQQVMQGTLLSHVDGGVPNLLVHIPQLTPYYFGQLVYFFEKACALSGYLQGVNPFDQPGVEAYKRNMLALLGKPGYEQERKALEKRLQKRKS